MTGTIDWEMYDEIVRICKQLGQHKNKQYGTESLKLFNGTAIVCRINDKIQRLNKLWETQQRTGIQQEATEDTLQDLINYAIYLLIYNQDGIT